MTSRSFCHFYGTTVKPVFFSLVWIGPQIDNVARKINQTSDRNQYAKEIVNVNPGSILYRLGSKPLPLGVFSTEWAYSEPVLRIRTTFDRIRLKGPDPAP